MYYSNITNKELQQFHKKIKITASYTELNNLDTDLFNKTQSNKCIPLFYADTITGNNNIRVLDDLCIVYTDNADMDSVYFKSQNTDIVFGVLHEIVTVNSKYYLKLHFFDSVSLFNLNEFSFNILQSNGGINQNNVTDKYGNCIIPLNTNTGTFTITSNNNQTITWSET